LAPLFPVVQGSRPQRRIKGGLRLPYEEWALRPTEVSNWACFILEADSVPYELWDYVVILGPASSSPRRSKGSSSPGRPRLRGFTFGEDNRKLPLIELFHRKYEWVLGRSSTTGTTGTRCARTSGVIFFSSARKARPPPEAVIIHKPRIASILGAVAPPDSRKAQPPRPGTYVFFLKVTKKFDQPRSAAIPPTVSSGFSAIV